jgi:hypothetical protein
VENWAASVEEWRRGCGHPVDDPVEDRGGRVEALRMAETFLVGTTVGASVATGLAAFSAWLAGSLGPVVGSLSITAGVVAGVAAARSVRCHGHAWGDAEPGLTRWGGVALAAFAVVSLRQFGWIVFERGGALLTLVPYNYGDLPLHWTYVASLAGGAPFWPENPILSGERLRYPFGVDLLTAVFVQLGVSMPVLLRAMGLVGAAIAALALRRWGGGFAVAGFLFAGGLAGFRLLGTGRIEDYQSAVAWKSLYLALFVPQRGFLLALPAGLLLLWSWRRTLLRGERGLAAWVEGVLWGVLPLVHLHTFAFLSVVFAVWAVGGRRVREALPTLAWAVAPATWAVWEVTDGFRAAALVGWRPGWMIGGEGPVLFLLLNFGLFLPLALVALWRAVKERHREDLLLLVPALAVFVALFLVKLAPWEWDNTKVMLWCYVAVLPPVFDLTVARLRSWVRAAAVVVLFFSGAVSVLAASLGRGPRLEVLDVREYEGVCRALAVVRTMRVATVQTFNHPVALCGHPIVAGYAGHLWSHGLDAAPVEKRLATLMRGEPGWREAAATLGASHVFWGWREQQAFPASTRPWAATGPPVASGPWGALYRLD